MLEESVLSLNMQRPRTSQAAAEATSGKPAVAVAEEQEQGREREQDRSVSAAADIGIGIGIGVVADLPNPNLAASMSGSFSALLQEFAGLELAPTPATAKAAARPEAAVSVPAPASASASALRAGRSDSFLVHVLRLGERPVPPDNCARLIIIRSYIWVRAPVRVCRQTCCRPGETAATWGCAACSCWAATPRALSCRWTRRRSRSP